MNLKRLFFRFLLPAIIVGVAVLVAMTLIRMRPKAEAVQPETPAPLIRAQEIVAEDVTFTIASQGTVRPVLESSLIPEVGGRVIEVSPNLKAGGFVSEGEILVKIDPFDYRQAVVTAESNLAKAKLALAREQAESDLARAEWNDLGEGEPDPLTLREPQLNDAKASVAAAEANLARTERDLERTVMRAPYDGRVLTKDVAPGEFVNRGAPLAQLYAIDSVEISLPVGHKDLAFIDLPDPRGAAGDDLPEVTIIGQLGDREFSREGRIVRTDGRIDPATRQLHLIAEVNDPYPASGSGLPALTNGMYVRASIQGMSMRNLVVMPRHALWGVDEALAVDAENRLYRRQLDIVRETSEQVFVRAGFEPGDRLVLTRLEAVTDGMQVRIAADDEPRAAEAQSNTESDR